MPPFAIEKVEPTHDTSQWIPRACIPPRRRDHNKHTWTSVVNVRASRTVWSQVLCEFCYASGLLMDKEIIYLSIDIAAMPIYLFDVNRISIHLDFVIKFELPSLQFTTILISISKGFVNGQFMNEAVINIVLNWDMCKNALLLFA